MAVTIDEPDPTRGRAKTDYHYFQYVIAAPRNPAEIKDLAAATDNLFTKTPIRVTLMFAIHPDRAARPSRAADQRGFTLIELVVTVAVAAVLITVAIPSFTNLIKDSRLIASSNLLVRSLAVARSEAVKRGSPVAMCASDNGTSCSGSWTQGWIVFTDAGTEGTVDGTDTVLRVEGSLRNDLAVNVAGSETAYVRFQPTGFLRTECLQECGPLESTLTASVASRVLAAVLPGRAAQAGNPHTTPSTTTDNSNTNSSAVSAVTEFTLCDGRSDATGRKISVWATGRFSSSTTSCASQ